MRSSAGFKNLRASTLDCPRAFTLVELLVSMVLIIIIVGMVVQITDQTSKVWLSATSRIQAFQEARAGYEAMTRKLGQATLNTYFEYYNANNVPRVQLSGTALAAFVPSTYDRYSELQFVSGQAQTFALQTSGTVTTPITTQTQAVFFQAPLGYSVNYNELDNALNACGYFIQFGTASTSVPLVIQNSPGYKPKWRFRLMEMSQPTEQLAIYSSGTSTATQNNWFVQNSGSNSRVIAENVIALALLPKLPDSQDDPSNPTGQGVSLAPNYNYNSKIPLNSGSDPWWSSFPGDSYTAYPIAGGTTTGTRHAQLPPMLRVVMVVIDETSAARIQGSGTTPPTGINLASTTLFTNAANLTQDIQSVEDICNAKPGNLTGNTLHLNYRVFSTDIIMRGAKWSNNN